MTETNITKRVQLLGKWLWLLFLLIIPSTVAEIITNENIVTLVPSLRLPGEIISMGVSLAYAFILLKISSESGHYRTAGICSLITAVGNMIVVLISGEDTPVADNTIDILMSDGDMKLLWTLMLTLLILIVSLVGQYQEFIAHSEVLRDVDWNLSEKWEKLWRWYIGTIFGMLAGIVVAFISALLGILVVLISAIAGIVVGILKLVYLYQTATRFRKYEVEKCTVE